MDQPTGSGPGQGDRSGDAQPAAEPVSRRTLLAVLAPWIIAALVVGLAAVGFVWARAPLARREILFESTLRIVPGASVTGAFTPEVDGPCAIELRFHEAWLEPLSETPRGGRVAAEALAKDVGGGWSGLPAAPGLTASYSIRSGGASVADGVTGDRLEGGLGYRGASVTLAWIDGARPVPHEFSVRIERAVDGLKRWDARLVVVATGDRISYALLEVELRKVIVVVASLVLVGLGALSWVLLRAASRRSDPVSGGRANGAAR